MYQYNGQTGQNASELFPSLWRTQEELDRATASCLTRVFLRMFTALLVTAASAFAVASLEALQLLIFSSPYTFIVLIVAEVALVVLISARMSRMSTTVANVLFFSYAIVNGLTLSVIFLVYELGVIYHAFAVSALMFAGMALFGAITKRDLSSIGSICIMALFGVVVASIANVLFFRSEMLEILVLYIGVAVFVGLTAYDVQRVKRMLEGANGANQDEAVKKISVMGALTLYLDFINLFLRLLRIMGRRR